MDWQALIELIKCNMVTDFLNCFTLNKSKFDIFMKIKTVSTQSSCLKLTNTEGSTIKRVFSTSNTTWSPESYMICLTFIYSAFVPFSPRLNSTVCERCCGFFERRDAWAGPPRDIDRWFRYVIGSFYKLKCHCSLRFVQIHYKNV